MQKKLLHNINKKLGSDLKNHYLCLPTTKDQYNQAKHKLSVVVCYPKNTLLVG
jgi:hypothetical protein